MLKKALVLLAGLMAGGLIATEAAARDPNVVVRVEGPGFGVRIGEPRYYPPPVIVAPPPRVYYPAPPVVYAPPPVVVYPAPPPRWGYYGPPGHYRKWKHHHHRHYHYSDYRDDDYRGHRRHRHYDD